MDDYEEAIFDDVHMLLDAYQMRNKERFKMKLAQLEFDLYNYKCDNNKEHEQSKKLIKYYEMMWEF